MPTYVFKEGLKSKNLKELTVELDGNIRIVQGKPEEKIGHLQGISGIKANNGLTLNSRPMGDLCKKVTWIVKAQKGTEVTLKCQGGRIGKVETKIIL